MLLYDLKNLKISGIMKKIVKKIMKCSKKKKKLFNFCFVNNLIFLYLLNNY